MDIKPPPKPKPQPLDLKPTQQQALKEFVPEAVPDKPPVEPKRKSAKKWVITGIILAIVLIIASVAAWGYVQTLPRDSAGHGRRVTIESGLAPKAIAKKLQDGGIIRSAFVFELYTKMQGVENQLQAGTYVLSPQQSLAEVVTHLTEGRVDNLQVTILPGLTVGEIAEDLVEDYGFNKDSVQAALDADYDHPLLAGKPDDATLEGYIFPETYEISGDASPEALFTKSFDELWARIQADKLQDGFKAQGFTLRQAIILASIIQREIADPTDQKQISQIFQKRLKENMPLGADATFVYAAKQLGVTPSVDLESPYNTRIHTGLTPGPISNFNLSALAAVVNPAPGDYLYFVSGDDGKTYYSKTLQEHEANTAEHCKSCFESF